MSRPKQFLLCDDAFHAELVDEFIMEFLRERDGAIGSSWSGVYTDGERFGVVWAAPGSDVFGTPEEQAELVIVQEDPDDPWSLVRQEQEPAP